jgi:LmbE family N-acetylglucosaminyl deacetylase
MAITPAGVITWGVLPEGCLERVLVCSPHFDDAALGAAYVLFAHPGSTVVTAFGGPPAWYPDPPTEWDALGGFGAGDDVVALRREEDRAAMSVLGATPVWLDFVDHQYLAPAERAEPKEIGAALADVLESVAPSAVFVPMGLANPDHVALHDAGMLLASERRDLTWFCYEEAQWPKRQSGGKSPLVFLYEDSGYKHIPGMLAWRVSKLFRAGLWPTPMAVPVKVDHERKRAAIECYKSQLAPLNRDHALAQRLDGSVPEQFWLVTRPPTGWERLLDM